MNNHHDQFIENNNATFRKFGARNAIRYIILARRVDYIMGTSGHSYESRTHVYVIDDRRGYTFARPRCAL